MPTIIDTTTHRNENTNIPSENPRSLCAHMKILVAEDDVPLAEFLQQRLGQEQFAVQIAATGGEAQRLAVEQPFDMVLLDLNLNGATGLDVLHGIRLKKPDIPVMLLTGANELEERIRWLDADSDDYISKTVSF